MELYLIYNSARRLLEKRGARVIRSLVGNYVTSLEMAGCSVTVSMLDTGVRHAILWDAPVETAQRSDGAAELPIAELPVFPLWVSNGGRRISALGPFMPQQADIPPSSSRVASGAIRRHSLATGLASFST